MRHVGVLGPTASERVRGPQRPTGPRMKGGCEWLRYPRGVMRGRWERQRDGLATYWDTMCAPECRGAWCLQHVTEPRENMPNQPRGILYRIYVYQKAAAGQWD